ncbi:MAG: C45 family peptidase [Clostridium sp.]|nr:C45 family peptidase [Prevotella sp.]MCM1428175.1 C45 family peptidase [Clostridium sp.]
MKSFPRFATLPGYRCLSVALSLLSLVSAFDARSCTSAVVAASASPYGRPMLWKHRDTSTVDNKVEYVPADDGTHAYVALFNAADRNLKEAWMGMNDVGFAVMNTASYNIKNDKVPNSKMDREGFLMTMALRTCRTLDDFRRLLDAYPRPMGVEANFGVIDAEGNGGYFETNNDSYVFYDLKDAPGGVLVRTNYSHSGRPNQGYGFVREANALHLLQPYIDNHEVTPELFTESLSRSFYHDLKKRDFSTTDENWVIDQDFIPRYKSTATIVIEGCRPMEDASEILPDELADQYIMWTGMGYPPCSEIIPVWCKPDGVDPELRGIGEEGHSPMCDKVKARRDSVFPLHKGNGSKYIDMKKLYNAEGTGYVQTLVPQNLEVYRLIRSRRGVR